jgi:hypothetical protein
MRRQNLTILAGLAWVACSNDFAPYSQLDRLRILGVASEPATPLPGESATLSALTFAPAQENTTYHWTWCPVTASASNGYACPVDQAMADQIFAGVLEPGSDLPSLDLGDAPTAVFANPFPLSALAALCSSGLSFQGFSQKFDCDEGFPISVVLDVATSTTWLRAGFVLRLPAADPPVINQNPGMLGLVLASIPLEGAASIAVRPGQKVDLQANIPAESIEIRPIPPAEGPPGLRLERLTTSWFTDAGRIDKARTVFIDGTVSLDQMSHNLWTAPKVEDWPASGVVQFQVVLRDDRGGEGWLVRQVQLEQAP